MKHRTIALVLTSLVLATASFVANAGDHTFSNTTQLSISDNGVAALYPAPIAVSGVPGNITNVSVTLHGINHTWIGDLNVLLVSPGGQKIALLGRVGSASPTAVGQSDNFANATLTFSATAAAPIPNPEGDINIPDGVYLPSVGLNLTPMPAPAPTGPYSSDLTTLNGVAANQAGSWNLYISDQSAMDLGLLAGGWSLTISDDVVPATTCASEGYTGTKLTWCKNVCENGLTGATLDIWIHRWINRYRDLPYCAADGGGEEETPPQEA